jgi:hypothetical protein
MQNRAIDSYFETVHRPLFAPAWPHYLAMKSKVPFKTHCPDGREND